MSPVLTLILLVGLPRSGKTTWARQQSYPIVSRDAIRLALHGQRFLVQAEPMVTATAHLMVRALFRAGHETVIVDGCHQSAKRRREWVDAFAPEGVDVEFMVIPTPPDVCRLRAEGEVDGTGMLPVIERMANDWDVFGYWKLGIERNPDTDLGDKLHRSSPSPYQVQVGHRVFSRRADLFGTVKEIKGEVAIVKPEWPHDGSLTQWPVAELRQAHLDE